MKKTISFLVLSSFVCLFFSCGKGGASNEVSVKLDASNYTDDGYFDGILYYTIISKSPNLISVNKAEKNAVSVEIPTYVSIDGVGSDFKCTSISYGAFKGCSNIETITIPDCIESIGDEAFYGCNKLTSVVIGNGVKSIGKDVFYQCGSLNSITIGESLETIGNGAFNSTNIASITLPNSVKHIGDRAFYLCSNLESVTIPNGVISIGEDAFRRL